MTTNIETAVLSGIEKKDNYLIHRLANAFQDQAGQNMSVSTMLLLAEDHGSKYCQNHARDKSIS